MSRPTTRVLAMLELLQDRQRVSGAELARRLEVDERTVRRYAARLQELGIPVEGERGRAGGYRLRPGYKLPPLMLTDDEATAVVVGLVAAQRFGLAAEAVDEALGKVRRVLPVALRERVRALEETLGFLAAPAAGSAPPPATETVLALADAARRGRRVSVTYESGRSGGVGQRELDAYGLVVSRGRWYLSARDVASDELRIFRADRVSGVTSLARRATPAPDGFDAADHVATALARVPWRYEVEVVLRDTTVEEIRRWVPAAAAELEPAGAGDVLLTARAEQLAGMARMLAGLGCDFEVLKPAELNDEIGKLAARLATAAVQRAGP